MVVTSKALDGIHVHPKTGAETWLNSIVLLWSGNDPIKSKLYTTTYGDGSPIDERDIQEAETVMEEEGVKWLWQKGDIILVDNLVAMHARNRFSPPRRILAAIMQ